MLIGDRDATWRAPVRRLLEDSGAGVAQTPDQALNATAYAGRFGRSIRDECRNRGSPFGERHLRRILTAFVEHDHGERNHQGLRNELIDRREVIVAFGVVSASGGLLNYYYRAA